MPEELKLVNLDSSFKLHNFSIAFQVATIVLIRPLVLNACQVTFWIQTTIVSDVDHYVIHAYKQPLKFVPHAYLDFMEMQEYV